MTFYIPDKLKVGFNTYDKGKLIGYFIYWDEKGKLRKETSWEGWRDKNLDPAEMENKPLEGFRVYRVRNGYRYSLWEQRDAKMMVEHPTMNCLFEITPANFLELITANGVDKNGTILTPCIMAWDGPSLVLMSTQSPEYAETVEHSAKVKSLKILKPEVGHTYRNKQGFVDTYLGRKVIYEEKVYENAEDAKKHKALDTKVFYPSRGWRSNENYYEIKKYNVYVLRNGGGYHQYVKTCPNFVSEVEDAEVLSEEVCTKEINDWLENNDWYERNIKPIMHWKFDYIDLTMEEVKDLVESQKCPRSYNEYRKCWELSFIVRPKYIKKDCPVNMMHDRDYIFLSEDGTITRNITERLSSLEEYVKKHHPCKIGYRSYLNPDEYGKYNY